MLAAGVPKKDIGVKLSQHAYKRFKEFLITGQIKTGAVMSQADLVRILDVPISPLREAVQVLESEGLVTVMPRSGIRIVQPDMEAIKNWFQLRHILEREAVSRYAISASTAEIDAWEQRHRQFGGGRRRRARRTDPQPQRGRGRRRVPQRAGALVAQPDHR